MIAKGASRFFEGESSYKSLHLAQSLQLSNLKHLDPEFDKKLKNIKINPSTHE